MSMRGASMRRKASSAGWLRRDGPPSASRPDARVNTERTSEGGDAGYSGAVSACPVCAEQVQQHDVFCRTCGHRLQLAVPRKIPYRTIIASIWLTVASIA